MRAMVLRAPRTQLEPAELEVPVPGPHEVLVRVAACGVCRTDLHVLDGELQAPKLPLIPGHEVVGHIAACGSRVNELKPGLRVGVPWLGTTCGQCQFCRRGKENLCERATFTGYTRDGGYAEYLVADERYCFPLISPLSDVEAAPLLCAGLIGYRSLGMAGNAERLGLYGFGAAAHIIAQVALQQGRKVFAFTKPGDVEGQRFASRLGVNWVGSSDELPSEPLDAAIIFAPVGGLVLKALRATIAGGTVVCAGIHMSDIPSFPYELLWRERSVKSVANLTRRDGEEFLRLTGEMRIDTTTTVYPLEAANQALSDLRQGRVNGALVLAVPSTDSQA